MRSGTPIQSCSFFVSTFSDHLARLDHALSWPGVSVLLVGRAGVGRRSLTQLAAYMHGLTVFAPAMGRSFDAKAARSFLKDVCHTSPASLSPFVLLRIARARDLVFPWWKRVWPKWYWCTNRCCCWRKGDDELGHGVVAGITTSPPSLGWDLMWFVLWGQVVRHCVRKNEGAVLFVEDHHLTAGSMRRPFPSTPPHPLAPVELT